MRMNTCPATIVWSSVPEFLAHLHQLTLCYYLWQLPWFRFPNLLNTPCHDYKSANHKFTIVYAFIFFMILVMELVSCLTRDENSNDIEGTKQA